MIDTLQPYREYRDSGLPWLPQVPSHWKVVRNGSLFGQRKDAADTALPILEVSLKTGVRVREFGGSHRKQVMSDIGKYKRAAKADVAYNMMRMWQGAVGVVPVDGLVSPAYVVARPFQDVESPYFAALFRTGDYMAEIDNYSRGIVKDRNRLYWDQFKQMPSPCPPPDEQAAIVRFLEWANGRLEGVIRAKRKVITLLQEQKQAVVHRAITRGLDTNVRLKPSGIPWLGDMPERWEVRRLKQIARMTSGENITALQIGQSGTYPVYGGNGLRGYTEQFTHEGHYALIGRQGALCGNVNFACGRFWASEHAIVPTLRPDVSVLWFGELIRAMNLRQYSQSAAQPGLSVEMIGNLGIPFPNLPEQEQIASAIEEQTRFIVNAINRLEREIELLKEYRTRLVTDVVTGKLDVTEASRNVPVESIGDAMQPEPEDFDDSEDDEP